MTFAYVRVSTQDQNPQRQIEAIKAYAPTLPPEQLFIDYQSGKDFNRTAYRRLLKQLSPGDTLIVKELDRLGRNKEQIRQQLDYFNKQKIRMRILELPTTLMETPSHQDWILELVNTILLEVLTSMAEQERLQLRRRQKEGIALAKKAGKYKGRQEKQLPVGFESLYKRWKQGQLSGVEFTKLLGYKSRSSMYAMVKRFEEEKSKGQNR